ncbi:MAG TPA: hypothetical protein VNQ79_26755 [Blastocatellia bacterium]|nr:hypothetical protein [Blastocatellia bacterium]
MKKPVVFAFALTLLAALAVYKTAHTQSPGAEVVQIVQHRINTRLGLAPTAGSTGVVTPAITHHGGPVIGTPTIYYIWYGNWNQANNTDTPGGQQILRDFAINIGGSPHFSINTTYSINGTSITGGVVFGGETTDNYSQGKRLTDNGVQKVVNNAINSGRLPYNANGVYFVLTSSDVAETSGFCTRYCGWHTAATLSGKNVRYSFVGNAARCITSCAAQTTGPNGNAGVDGMASVIAHELEEATTDPDLNAWYDSNGAENADKCAWTFGQSQYQTANGAWANMRLGTRDFLIQRNLKHASSGDTCNVDLTHQ